MTTTPTVETEPASQGHPLRGLLVAQFFGSFNDNAWKQVVILLAMGAAAATLGKAQAQQQAAALAQVVLMIPLTLFSLPAGVLADRLSKRTVILAMKGLELALMAAGAAILFARPAGGTGTLVILALLGVQASLFSPSKYGILPEILPHEQLSAGNGLFELWNNLAIIAGTVAGGVLLSTFPGRPWLGGAVLTGFSAIGLAAALAIPRVPVARAEGGLITTVKIAAEAIKADRILRLAIVGQIIVWSIASLVPAPIMAYAKHSLRLPDWETGLPLAALGIGIGLGCFLAGKLSGAKVEYGLLPLGALGLSASTLAFALVGPGLAATIVLMGLIGVFSGLVFVPLNALLQWRSPEDRRGAVIATANVLEFGGMLAGSLAAWALAAAGITVRGTFLWTSFALSIGFLWALWLVPEAFLRFVLVLLGQTLYRIRVIGRANLPAEGGALLIPNHVSFVDGLFLIASVDRPIRFVVYAGYFDGPIVGRFLRAIGAIPISAAGGPKMILRAFREAGRALDEGRLVCIFPEGQLTRNGLLQPFQRGYQRIVKGRDVPLIPIHLDRVTTSIFAPAHDGWIPERFPLPVTVSIGQPLPTSTPLFEVRRAIRDLDEAAWAYRKADRRPLHHGFIRRTRRHPFRLALADLQRPRLSAIGALAATIALARALRPRWEGQENVGILLPTSVAGALTNLAAALAGRAAVNLNFTTGRAGLESAARQAALRTVVTSRQFLEKARVELPGGVEPIWLEDLGAGIGLGSRLLAMWLAWLAPIRWLERTAGATRRPTVDDVATIIFSSGSTGEPKGVVLSHLNIGSNVEAIAQIFRPRTDDRLMAILPLFHSFGYTIFWFAADRGVAFIGHPNPLDAGAVGDLVQRYAATILLATPTFLQLYMRRCTPAQFGSLRLVLAGAEKLPESLALGFEDRFGIKPVEGYGMTECSPVVAASTLDYRAPGTFQPGSRRGTVGQPLPGVSVRIVDPESYRPLGPDEPGLVLVKGPNVMRGYLGRDDLTAAAIRDGWYVTGDIGQVSEDGFLRITGRLSRFSKIGGEMVPHGRVEDALQRAAGADAQVFAVTAVGDERKGERLAVLHTLDESRIPDVLSRLAAEGLPNLFIPRRDQFLKVETIPVLGTGKLDLRAIRRVAEERLAHPEPAGAAPR